MTTNHVVIFTAAPHAVITLLTHHQVVTFFTVHDISGSAVRITGINGKEVAGRDICRNQGCAVGYLESCELGIDSAMVTKEDVIIIRGTHIITIVSVDDIEVRSTKDKVVALITEDDVTATTVRLLGRDQVQCAKVGIRWVTAATVEPVVQVGVVERDINPKNLIQSSCGQPFEGSVVPEDHVITVDGGCFRSRYFAITIELVAVNTTEDHISAGITGNCVNATRVVRINCIGCDNGLHRGIQNNFQVSTRGTTNRYQEDVRIITDEDIVEVQSTSAERVIIPVNGVTTGSANSDVKAPVSRNDIGSAVGVFKGLNQVEGVAIRIGQVGEIQQAVITEHDVVTVIQLGHVGRGCLVTVHGIHATVIDATQHDVGDRITGHGIGTTIVVTDIRCRDQINS